MKKCLALFFLITGILSCSSKEPLQTVQEQGSTVSLPVRNLSEKKPVLYKTTIDKTSIEFFLVKINNEVSLYLNRCRECFSSGKGFGFEGENVRCRTCNEIYPIAEIANGIGSCYPIKVPGKIRGDNYVFEKTDVFKAFQSRGAKL